MWVAHLVTDATSSGESLLDAVVLDPSQEPDPTAGRPEVAHTPWNRGSPMQDAAPALPPLSEIAVTGLSDAPPR